MENKLDITVSRAGRAGDVTVLALDGRLHTGTARILETKLNELLIHDGNQKLVIDMSRVPFLSSAGMRSLLAGAKTARSRGGGLKIAALLPDIRKLFATTGLDKMFDVHDTVDEAVAAF